MVTIFGNNVPNYVSWKIYICMYVYVCTYLIFAFYLICKYSLNVMIKSTDNVYGNKIAFVP